MACISDYTKGFTQCGNINAMPVDGDIIDLVEIDGTFVNPNTPRVKIEPWGNSHEFPKGGLENKIYFVHHAEFKFTPRGRFGEGDYIQNTLNEEISKRITQAIKNLPKPYNNE